MPTTNTPATTAQPTGATPITATAASSSHNKKVDLQAAYQALTVALQGQYQPGDLFALRSGNYTRDELIAEFQKFIAVAEATKGAHNLWRTAVQDERAFEVQVRPLRQGVRSIVVARFGSDGTQLMRFGFTQGKQGKKTATTKAAAVDKTKATRVARATKGKKQRKAIKGTVPATSAPAPAPAIASPIHPTTGGSSGSPG
jgi:hypothetical protein